MFFRITPPSPVIFEIEGRALIGNARFCSRQQAAEGVAIRFQQALGRRFVFVVDAFGVNRNGSSVSGGGRTELETGAFSISPRAAA